MKLIIICHTTLDISVNAKGKYFFLPHIFLMTKMKISLSYMLILPLVTNFCFYTLLLMQIDFNLNAISLGDFKSVR